MNTYLYRNHERKIKKFPKEPPGLASLAVRVGGDRSRVQGESIHHALDAPFMQSTPFRTD